MKSCKAHRHRVVEIRKVREESPTVKSLIFKDKLCAAARPGQFSMIWVPGFDEIPMSVSVDPESSDPMIMVKRVGEATAALHRLKEGDLIGVRGPYGTFFKLNGQRRVLLVAGGTGIAPLLKVALDSKRIGYECHLVMGAKEEGELLFVEELREAGCVVYPVTEDGSLGDRGTVQNVLRKIPLEEYGLMMCCGPELMIASAIALASSRGIKVQASLERVMKCGVGICGSCELAGYRVCKDGPVFNLEDLKRMADTLGRFKRSPSGRRIKVEY
ncbi:MAG: dihydroorotate dehydrogenase electron transfer subunit [Candidatus Bathyarchaeia archaeon]